MSNFANLNEENVVINVIVGNPNLSDKKNLELVKKIFDGKWVQTSYNTFAGEHKLGGIPLRKNYAGIGMTYDEEKDAFLYPKPYESWLLEEETCQWKAPIEMPTDDKMYVWDETSVNWVEQ
jgi:hypothetical protein